MPLSTVRRLRRLHSFDDMEQLWRFHDAQARAWKRYRLTLDERADLYEEIVVVGRPSRDS